jgi:large subunit ribosomal protein L1
MSKHGKKYLAALAKFDPEQVYNPRQALTLVKETAYASFDGTVEIHLRMGLDPRQADQMVRDVVVLPHGLGKTVRVLVFAQGEGATRAQEAGADYIADSDEWITKIQGGFTDFDVAIATPDMMGKAGKLGRVLGPRGLMPFPPKIWGVSSWKPKPVVWNSAWIKLQICMSCWARFLLTSRSCSRIWRH